MINLQESLRKLGLNDKEIALFLGSLKLGPQPVSILAKKAGINRSNAYDCLGLLVRKGLFSSFLKSGVRIYEAINPDMLLRYVDNKRLHLNECRRDIEHLLPSFKSLANVNALSDGTKIRYFEGVEGVKLVMEDTLTSKGLLFCYSSLSRWFENYELGSYIRQYVKRRIFEKKIPLRGVVFDELHNRRCLDKSYSGDLYDYKYICTDVIDNETNIYDDKVAIVSLKKDNYFGLIIESPQIASTQKLMFEMMWLAAKKA